MQSNEALRHIAHKLDLLIETLNNGHGGAAAAPEAPRSAGSSEVAVLPHLQRILTILDPGELLGAIVSAGVQAVGAQRGFLMLIEEGTKLRFKCGHQVDQSTLASPGFAGARALVKQVLQEGRTLLQDAGQAQAGARTMLCAPLRFGARLEGRERVGGAIYVDSPAALGEEQRVLLDHLAGPAAIALENARLYYKVDKDRAEIERLKDNITKLLEVGRSIGSTLILEDLLVLVVDHVVELSKAQRGFIMLLEGPDADRKLVFKVGRDSRKRDLGQEHFKFSTTMAKRTIDQKKSQIMLDAVGEDNISTSIVQMNLQSIMCVPLIEKDRVIGLVYVDSQQSNREFQQSDLEIVESLCSHAAVSITNAKLYRDAGERERLAHELDLAARIQSDLLPKVVPEVEGLEMFGIQTPALEIGGDYFDFIPHEKSTDTISVVIGDVSGKGVGAGLVMAMTRSALRSLIGAQGIPASTLPIMRAINELLVRDTPKATFMTINLLQWSAKERKLRYTPAGHEHLLIWRKATGKVEKIKAGGVACGVLKQASAMMKECELPLAPGDHVVLYTDGVTEAMDILHQPYGLETLVDYVQQHGHLDPKALCKSIEKQLIDFRGAADPHDDITLVCLRAR